MKTSILTKTKIPNSRDQVIAKSSFMGAGLALASLCWLPSQASAVTVALPNPGASITSNQAATNINLGIVAQVGVGPNAATNNAVGSGWSGTASGSLFLNVLDVPLLGVTAATVNSRTYTNINSTGVTFGTTTSITGLAGTAIGLVNTITGGLLNPQIVNLAAFQTWGATVDLSAQGLSVATNSAQQLSFDFANLTGLINGLDPSLGDAFRVRVLDGNNVVLLDAQSNNGLLGLVNLFDANGSVTLDFNTQNSGDLRVEFTADGLLTGTTTVNLIDQLLDNTNSTDLYRVSNFQVVPEPSHGMLAMVSLLALLRWRRR